MSNVDGLPNSVLALTHKLSYSPRDRFHKILVNVLLIRNYWYAAILESDADNPKLKTGQTVSRFKINRKNCLEVRLCPEIKKNQLSRFQFGSESPIYGQRWIKCFENFSVFCIQS